MKKLTLGALVMALVLPAAAQAASMKDEGAAPVRLNDLNLHTRADAAIALRRLDRAALDACGAADGSLRSFKLVVQRSSCHREAMDRAVSALASPTVNSLYRDRGAVYAQN